MWSLRWSEKPEERDRNPSFPRSPEITGDPHSHMAASPLTW